MGHLPLFERAPVASMVRANLVSQVILIFRVNQKAADQRSGGSKLQLSSLVRVPGGRSRDSSWAEEA